MPRRDSRRDTARRVASAISTHAREHAARVQNVVHGVVKDVNPLVVEVGSGPSDILLYEDDGDLVLTQWADWYNGQIGIEVGETVLLTVQEHQSWYTVLDVVSENEVTTIQGDVGRYTRSGSGSGASYTITQDTHGLRASRFLMCQCQDISGGPTSSAEVVSVDVSVAPGGDVTFIFGDTVDLSNYQFTIIG